IAKSMGVKYFRGSEADVLDRFYQAVKDEKPEYVVRLTSDCPLIDSNLIDAIIQYTINKNLDYCSNTLNPGYPDGQDVEVFKFAALEKAWKEANLVSEREHVTPYIWKNSTFKKGELFSSDNFDEGFNMGHLRMTVDEQKDFNLIAHLVKALDITRPWLEYA